MSRAAPGYGEVLAMEVLDRLHHLDLIAVGAQRYRPAEVVRIREELTRRVAMWRRLLFRHTPESDGGRHCPVCRCGWRRRRWPCSVWAQAHARLVAGLPPPPPRPENVRATPPVILRRPAVPRPDPARPPCPGPAGVTSDLRTDQSGRHREQ